MIRGLVRFPVSCFLFPLIFDSFIIHIFIYIYIYIDWFVASFVERERERAFTNRFPG